MKIVSIVLGILFFGLEVNGQTILLGQNDTLCPGQALGIVNNSISNPPYLSFNSPNSIVVADDGYSSSVPIGFGFNFFGVNYTHLKIGSNGVLSFDLTSTYCPWYIDTTMPNSNYHKNSIMACWMDLNSLGSSGSSIRYETIGIAPNRKFIVQYKNIPQFSCFGPICWDLTVVLKETTDVIDIYIRNKPICATWNGGFAIQGIQNSAGNVAYVTPGRNHPNVWTTQLDGKRFMPGVGNTYSIQDVSYLPLYDSLPTLQWFDTDGNSYSYSDTLQVISPSLGSETGYFLGFNSFSTCIGQEFILSDTTLLTTFFNPSSFQITPDTCGNGTGQFFSTDPNSLNSTYFWPSLSQFADTLYNLSVGIYPVIYDFGNGCTGFDSIEILIDPIVNPAYSLTMNTCSNGNGIFVSDDPSSTNNQFYWPSLGIYSDTLFSLNTGVYSFMYTAANGCTSNDTIEITGPTANLTISTFSTPEIYGYDGSIMISAVGGIPPYLYSIGGAFTPFGIHSNLPSGNYWAKVMDQNGCIDSMLVVLDSQLSISDLMIEGTYVYPNPFGNELIISTSHLDFKYFIFETTGKTVQFGFGNSSMPIDVSGLSPGFYIISIESDEGAVERYRISK